MTRSDGRRGSTPACSASLERRLTNRRPKSVAPRIRRSSSSRASEATRALSPSPATTCHPERSEGSALDFFATTPPVIVRATACLVSRGFSRDTKSRRAAPPARGDFSASLQSPAFPSRKKSLRTHSERSEQRFSFARLPSDDLFLIARPGSDESLFVLYNRRPESKPSAFRGSELELRQNTQPVNGALESVWQRRFLARARIHLCRKCPKINAASGAEGFPSKQKQIMFRVKCLGGRSFRVCVATSASSFAFRCHSERAQRGGISLRVPIRATSLRPDTPHRGAELQLRHNRRRAAPSSRGAFSASLLSAEERFSQLPHRVLIPGITLSPSTGL